MQPQSEELYQLYIQVLMQQNQHKQALEVYASYETMLYKESGQKPSESLQTLYREIIKELNNMHADISTVKNDLREANAGNGAYYCPYDIFKNMYRLLARSVSRTGQSVYLLLFTVSVPEATAEPSKGSTLRCVRFSWQSESLCEKGMFIPSTAEPSMW